MPVATPTDPPLFERLIGPSFGELPPAIRAVHCGHAHRVYSGRCRIVRGTGLLSRACGAIASLPPASEDAPIRVAITAGGGRETWARDFGGSPMRSTLRASGGLLEERLGAMQFRFRLAAQGGRIDWTLRSMRFLGIALPVAWFSNVGAAESVRDGLYEFFVRVELPLAGLLVEYRGTLDAFHPTN